MRLTREFFLPKEFAEKVTREGVEAEVYLIDGPRGPVAKGFGGKRAKPDFHFRFRDAERRDEYVKEYLDGLEARAKEKEKAKTIQKEMKTTLKPGDILYNSWGYDQTNIDFYKVVEVSPTGKTVKILPVWDTDEGNYNGGPCRHVVASDQVKDWDVILRVDRGWDKKPIRKPVRFHVYGDKVYESVALSDRYRASKWDGRPMQETGPGWGH